MLKFELNQKTYVTGNETVTNIELLLFLEKTDFFSFMTNGQKEIYIMVGKGMKFLKSTISSGAQNLVLILLSMCFMRQQGNY